MLTSAGVYIAPVVEQIIAIILPVLASSLRNLPCAVNQPFTYGT